MWYYCSTNVLQMKYNDTSYKFYLHKVKMSNKEGYIYLRKIKDRKKSYESLKLPKIKEEYWNSTTQRVRERKEIDYEFYNEIIETKVKELTSSFDYPFSRRKDKKSFIDFFERYLNSPEMSDKHGTRIKYYSVLNKIKKHLDSNNLNDLSFSDLNLNYIKDFQNFCKSDGLKQNSTINYLKVIRIIIRKSQKIEGYYDVRDSFVNFTFPRVEKKLKEYLTKNEIQKVIRKEITNLRLNKVRNLFLFQLFSKGMRVSDLITLRFNNLVNGRIQYRMFKTSNTSDLPISLLHIELLEPFIEFKTKLNEITITPKSTFQNEEFEKLKRKRDQKKSIGKKPNSSSRPTHRSPIKGIDIYPYKNVPYLVDLYTSFQRYSDKEFSQYDQFLNQMNINELKDELKNLIEFKDKQGKIYVFGKTTIDYNKEYELIKELIPNEIERVSNRIRQITNTFLNSCIKELNNLGYGERKSEFVFGFLKNENYTNIGPDNDFSFITEGQYKRINKVSVVYNRNLKELQKLVGLDKTLKSHLPRVSYTNLMLNLDGISPYDIMEGLSHSSLTITDVYLRTGFKKEKTDDIQRDFEKSVGGLN